MLEADDAIDFAADAEALAPSADRLASVSDLILQQLALQGEVAELEQKLKEKKADLRRIEEGKLPGALKDAQTLKFTTTDGISVEVKSDLSMSIPKKNKQAVNDWLRKNDLGALIAPMVEVTLLKGQDNLAGLLTGFLDEHGFSYVREDVVNTTSVKAAVNKRLEDGKEVPLSLLGGHVCEKAVIKLPKV